MKVMKAKKEGMPALKKAAKIDKHPPKKVKKTLKKPAASANATVKVRDDLNYDPKWKSGARYYGCSTLYVDNGRGMWRVKPGCGRRDDRKFKFGTAENKVAVWRELAAHVKSIQ